MSDVRIQHFPPSALDHSSHAKLGIHPFPDKLYVLTMLENPLRFRSRYANYSAFERHCEDSGAILYTVEVAFGKRKYEITEPSNPRHLQLTTEENHWRYELWHKENALNLLMARLPHDAKYIAWIDSDVDFTRTDWVQETLHLLQHYQVIQMFSHSQNLGPNSEPLGKSEGYVYSKYQNPDLDVTSHMYYSGAGQKGAGLWVHPGFAWAARRDALNHLGGFVDWCIMGNGDWVMAAALFGEVHKALFGPSDAANDRYHPNYKLWAEIWQNRAERYIRRNVGFMPGLIVHKWHGTRANRFYNTRWRLLVDTQFDPIAHLKRDVQGLWQLTQETDFEIALRDGLRKYQQMRDEDSTYKGDE